MNLVFKSFSAIALSVSAAAAFAAPTFLTTHNKTDVESNAFIAGAPSPYPTKANSSRQVHWNMVRMACFGHIKDNKCYADVKMATNTSSPILLGTVGMDLDTGDITPKTISSQGYTLTVNGPGETTLTKN